MALTAVLEIGDNGIKRYQKQYMLSDFRIVFNRSYNVLPTSMARTYRNGHCGSWQERSGDVCLVPAWRLH